MDFSPIYGGALLSFANGYDWLTEALYLPRHPRVGTWEVAVEHNGTELAREAFAVIPEPATGLLCALGLLMLAVRRVGTR